MQIDALNVPGTALYTGANTAVAPINGEWVKKQYPGRFDRAGVEQVTRDYTLWLPKLEQLGIDIPAMRLAFRPSGRETYQLTLYEESFKVQELCGNLLIRAAPEVVLGVSRKFLEVIVNLDTANSGIGIDLKFGNFALRGGKLVLIDTFPPMADPHHTRDLLPRQMRSKLHSIGLRVSPQLLDSFIAEFYQPEFMLHKLNLRFRSKRPELGPDFETAAREIISERSPPHAEALFAALDGQFKYPPIRRLANALAALQP